MTSSSTDGVAGSAPGLRAASADLAGGRPLGARDASHRMVLVAIAAAALLAAWPVFVFTGSQAAFLVATLASCTVAAVLAGARKPVVLAYLIGVVAVIGPDANGRLGAGLPWLGTLRIFDATAVAAAAAVAWSARKEGWWRPRQLRSGWLRGIAVLAVVYAVARWLSVGHPRGALLNTDARYIAIGVLVTFIAWRCPRGPLHPVLEGIVVVGLLAALKAVAIHLSGTLAIGEYDRLQASSFISAGHLRTILVGGDTALILVPATCLVLAHPGTGLWRRGALAIVGVVALAAVSLSETRTSVLVAVGLTALTTVALLRFQNRRLDGSMLLLLVAGGVVVVAVVTISGVGGRLTHADAPHVGLNFRADEVDSFLRLPTTDKVLGQGLAGSFVGRNFSGHSVVAGWAHELPLWLALKDGVLGLALAVVAAAIVVRRVFLRWRSGRLADEVLLGCGYVLALVLMSLTIDRVALVEGLVILLVAVRLISPAAPRIDT